MGILPRIGPVPGLTLLSRPRFSLHIQVPGPPQNLVQERYDITATVQQINFTVGQTSEWIQVNQEIRQTDEETFTLQKIVTDWQNYSKEFSVDLNQHRSKKNHRPGPKYSKQHHSHGPTNYHEHGGHARSCPTSHGLQLQLDNITSFLFDDHEETCKTFSIIPGTPKTGLWSASRAWKAGMFSHETEILGRYSPISMLRTTTVHNMLKYLDDVRLSCTHGFNSHAEELYYLNKSVSLMQGAPIS
ncbi:unnamed protein product [Ranitomeya imitator]|uniref:Uncharacterized protein n=1 Tax=Ranitomeya imitator TaxID=111125 RepID=A0ABN9KTV2_9NEOB|nr:unnamed protein product [Ranitomeya imitator]